MKRLRGPPSPPLRDAPENARDGGSGSAADETKGGSSERSSHTGGGGNSAAIEPDSLLSEDERDENVGGGDPPSLGRQVACLRACGRPWSAEEGKRFRDALPLDLLQRMVTEYLRTPAAERFRELAPSLPPSDGGGDDGGELRARKFESDVRSRSERWVRSMCVTAADVRQWERRARESDCLSEYPPTSPVHGAPDDERETNDDDERETNDDDNSGAKLYERAGVRFREMRRVMRLCETTLGSTHVERTGSALDSLPKAVLAHLLSWCDDSTVMLALTSRALLDAARRSRSTGSVDVQIEYPRHRATLATNALFPMQARRANALQIKYDTNELRVSVILREIGGRRPNPNVRTLEVGGHSDWGVGAIVEWHHDMSSAVVAMLPRLHTLALYGVMRTSDCRYMMDHLPALRSFKLDGAPWWTADLCVIALRPALVDFRIGFGGAFTCDAALSADRDAWSDDYGDPRTYEPQSHRRERHTWWSTKGATQSSVAATTTTTTTTTTTETYDLERLWFPFYEALPEARDAAEIANLLAKWPCLREIKANRRPLSNASSGYVAWERALVMHPSLTSLEPGPIVDDDDDDDGGFSCATLPKRPNLERIVWRLEKTPRVEQFAFLQVFTHLVDVRLLNKDRNRPRTAPFAPSAATLVRVFEASTAARSGRLRYLSLPPDPDYRAFASCDAPEPFAPCHAWQVESAFGVAFAAIPVAESGAVVDGGGGDRVAHLRVELGAPRATMRRRRTRVTLVRGAGDELALLLARVCVVTIGQTVRDFRLLRSLETCAATAISAAAADPTIPGELGSDDVGESARGGDETSEPTGDASVANPLEEGGGDGDGGGGDQDGGAGDQDGGAGDQDGGAGDQDGGAGDQGGGGDDQGGGGDQDGGGESRRHVRAACDLGSLASGHDCLCMADEIAVLLVGDVAAGSVFPLWSQQ